MSATARRFTSEEWEVVDAWLDHIYAAFTGKGAVGRNLTAERVHELARGRVWPGADARERSLVDEVGGIEDAAVSARSRAGMPGTAPLVHYPRLSPLDRLRPASNSEDRRAAAGLIGGGVADTPGAVGAELVAESWGPVWQLAARCAL